MATADQRPERLTGTYSIVARDPATGALGCAVQSHFFAVGTAVPWVRGGIGAVATQAKTEPSYGRHAIERIAEGQAPEQALAMLLMDDPGRELRQVGLVDAWGQVAVHTGTRCIPEAGHHVGEGYAVQANLMARPGVPERMADAFEAADGDLAARLLVALEAAERHGGDVRGRQSAALIVEPAPQAGQATARRSFDVRVDDHPDPLGELARLVRLQRAYASLSRGAELLAAGELEDARHAYREAAEMAPDHLELQFWEAVALIEIGSPQQAAGRLREVTARAPGWTSVLHRLADVGLLPRAAVDHLLG